MMRAIQQWMVSEQGATVALIATAVIGAVWVRSAYRLAVQTDKYFRGER